MQKPKLPFVVKLELKGAVFKVNDELNAPNLPQLLVANVNDLNAPNVPQLVGAKENDELKVP